MIKQNITKTRAYQKCTNSLTTFLLVHAPQRHCSDNQNPTLAGSPKSHAEKHLGDEHPSRGLSAQWCQLQMDHMEKPQPSTHPSREVPHQHSQMGFVNQLRHLQMWGEADIEQSPVLSTTPFTCHLANELSAANGVAVVCADYWRDTI